MLEKKLIKMVMDDSLHYRLHFVLALFFWPHIKISTWLLLPCPCFTFGLLSLSGTDGQAAGLH